MLPVKRVHVMTMTMSMYGCSCNDVQHMMGSMTSMKGAHHIKASMGTYIVKYIAVEVMVKAGIACNVHYSRCGTTTFFNPQCVTWCSIPVM